MGNIILLFILVSLCLAIIACFLYFNFKKDKMIDKYEPILFFLELDLKKWRIKKSHLLINEMFEKYNKKAIQYIDKKIGNGWINISQLFDSLEPVNRDKWKKAIEYCVQNKSNFFINQKIKIESFENTKNTIIFFKLKFQYVNDKKIVIEYRSQNKLESERLFNKIITKDQLFNTKHKYRLFIAFSVIKNSLDTFITFIDLFDKLIKNKNIRYFKTNAIIVATITNESYRKINRIKKIIQSKLKKSLNKNNINNFFDGLTFVECQNLETENDFSKIMTRISFGLIKSKTIQSSVHFNLKNIQFNEFEEFKEKIININNMIESNRIEFEKLSVYSSKTKKEIYNFLIPKFQIENDYWNENILKINNFDKKIEDQFVSNILSSNKKLNKKTLININDYQIEKIFENMKNNREFIFIINQTKYSETKEFISLLKLLNVSKIKFGFYVEEFSSSFFSVITNVKPSVIVLSEKVNSNLEEKSVVNKLRILNSITIISRLKIPLVFTNVNDKVINEIELLPNEDKYYMDRSIKILF